MSDWSKSMVKQIESVNTCQELQIILDDVTETLNAQKAALAEQLAALAPIQALLTAPGIDPSKIVTWITDFIAAQLAPQYQAYLKTVTELTELTSEITTVVSALSNKISTLGCDISVPSI